MGTARQVLQGDVLTGAEGMDGREPAWRSAHCPLIAWIAPPLPTPLQRFGSTHRSQRALVFALLAGCIGLLLLTGALMGRQATGTRAIMQQRGMGRRGIGKVVPDDIAGIKVQRMAAAGDGAGAEQAARGAVAAGVTRDGQQQLAAKQQRTGEQQQQREGAARSRQHEPQRVVEGRTTKQ